MKIVNVKGGNKVSNQTIIPTIIQIYSLSYLAHRQT